MKFGTNLSSFIYYFEHLTAEQWIALCTAILAAATFASILFSWRSLKRQGLFSVMPLHGETLRKTADEMEDNIPILGDYDAYKLENKTASGSMNELLKNPRIRDLVINHTKYREGVSFVTFWNICENMRERYLDTVEEALKRVRSSFEEVLNGKSLGIAYNNEVKSGGIGYNQNYVRLLEKNWHERLHFLPLEANIKALNQIIVQKDEKLSTFNLKDENGAVYASGSEEQVNFLKELLVKYSTHSEELFFLNESRRDISLFHFVYSILIVQVRKYIQSKKQTVLFLGQCSFTGFSDSKIKAWLIEVLNKRFDKKMQKCFPDIQRWLENHIQSNILSPDQVSLKGLGKIISNSISKDDTNGYPFPTSNTGTSGILFLSPSLLRYYEPIDLLKFSDGLDSLTKRFLDLDNFEKQPMQKSLRSWVQKNWDIDLGLEV